MNAAMMESVIGRRLARRAVALVTETTTQPGPRGLVDLTRAADPAPPPAVVAAAHAALDRGETHYTARPGIPQLCAALAARSAAEGFPAEPGSVVVTNGGSEALYIALQSVARPGSRVLLAGPVAPNIPKMIAFIGATPIQVDSTSSSPTAATIGGYDADILLLASPSPITGVAIAPDELAEIVRGAGERGMAVILDRSLAWCCYDPALAYFPDPELGATVLTTGSFSLAYEMAGWRAGYFTAPAQHAGSMLELKQAMSICTSAISQFAALAALEAADDWLSTKRSTMQTRRDAVILRLEQAGLPTIVPDSWPYLLLDTRLVHPDDRQATNMLRDQAGVIVEAASRYGPSLAGYCRINLAADGSEVDAGLDRLIRFHSTCS
jgi:aspartate/methionine/tyrosine aminotransferase